jgi:hypothetical protein
MFQLLLIVEKKNSMLLLNRTWLTSQTWFCSVWAGFPERTRDGSKFVVAERPVKQVRRNFCAETADTIIEERKSRRENASNGFFDESGVNNSASNLLDALFSDD